MSGAKRQADVVIVGGAGESLPPGVEPLFEQLGVGEAIRAARFVRYSGIWVEWDGPPHFMPFGQDEKGPWLGFQAWRAELDALLLERARTLGVEVLQPCRVLHPLRGEQGEVVGVETDAGPVHARVVLDAAGGTHWLARYLDVPRLAASPQLVATYGYVTESEGPPASEPRLVADDKGWTWTAAWCSSSWMRWRFSARRASGAPRRCTSSSPTGWPPAPRSSRCTP